MNKMDAKPTCPQCGADLYMPDDVTSGVVSIACDSCGLISSFEVRKQEQQIFEWLFEMGTRTVAWNISELQAFLEGMNLKTQVMSVKNCKRFLDMNPHAPDDAGSSFTEGPVVLIPHPDPYVRENGMPYLPIDGWHRMRKAVDADTNATCICLTEQGEKRFRVYDRKHGALNPAGETQLEKEYGDRIR